MPSAPARALTSSLFLLLFGCGLLLLPGCASTDGPTRGWGVTLRISDPNMRLYVFYKLQRDGTLVYNAGDQNARDEEDPTVRPLWSGMLTPEEIRPICDLMEQKDALDSTDTPQPPRFRVEAKLPSGWLKSFTDGPSPFMLKLRQLFDTIQKSRRAKVLEHPGLGPPLPK